MATASTHNTHLERTRKRAAQVMDVRRYEVKDGFED